MFLPHSDAFCEILLKKTHGNMKSICFIQSTEKKTEKKFAFVSVRGFVPVEEFSRSPTVLFVLIVCSVFTAFLTLYKFALFKSLKIAEEHNALI